MLQLKELQACIWSMEKISLAQQKNDIAVETKIYYHRGIS
jgi:hypothetical protein